MPHRALSSGAVTTLFLERQHLAHPRAAALTAGRLARFVEDVGGLQLDSINVLERAHYLTVWSRFGPYDRARLDRLIYGRRLLFEYWAHAACLVSTGMLPWWRRAMLDYRVRHTGWSDLVRGNAKVLGHVKSTVAASGPMGSADFEGRRPSGRDGWWSWRPVQHALHYLWMTGALTIHSRRHFHKRFDLLERAIPAVLDGAVVSTEEFQRWHLERSLHAMGAATERDLAGYLTFPRFQRGARTATTRFRFFTTGISSAASTPSRIAPSAGSRCGTCTSSRGWRPRAQRHTETSAWIWTRRSRASRRRSARSAHSSAATRSRCDA